MDVTVVIAGQCSCFLRKFEIACIAKENWVFLSYRLGAPVEE